jgi:hypothetical protein
MGRRTEMAYKAESPGKLARHNEALDSGDTVNAAVVSPQFTSLFGEICSACTWSMSFGSLNEARVERLGQPQDPTAWGRGASGEMPEVSGQKSAEVIVAKRLP